MTEEELRHRLQREGLPDYAVGPLVERILHFQPDILTAFTVWQDSDEMPDLEVEGYSAARLVAEFGLHPIGAFDTLDRLARARDALDAATTPHPMPEPAEMPPPVESPAPPESTPAGASLSETPPPDAPPPPEAEVPIAPLDVAGEVEVPSWLKPIETPPAEHHIPPPGPDDSLSFTLLLSPPNDDALRPDSPAATPSASPRSSGFVIPSGFVAVTGDEPSSTAGKAAQFLLIAEDGTQIACDTKPIATSTVGKFYPSLSGEYVCLQLDARALERDPQFPHRLEGALVRHGMPEPVASLLFTWPEKLIVSPQLGAAIKTPAVGLRPLTNFLLPPEMASALVPSAERGTFLDRIYIAWQLATATDLAHQAGLTLGEALDPHAIWTSLSERRTLVNAWCPFDLAAEPPPESNGRWGVSPETAVAAELTLLSDRHSLAVLVYWLLLGRHPLEGPRRFPHLAPEEEELYRFGQGALYIEHPTDHSNRPDPLPHRSDSLTGTMQSLLQRAFVDGLHAPEKRPRPEEWSAALWRLADRVVPCANADCPLSEFVVPDTNRFRCPWCGAPFTHASGRLPILRLYRPDASGLRYVFDDSDIVGYAGRRLFRHHARPGAAFNDGDDQVVADVKSRDNGWYLRNLGLEEMRLIPSAGGRPTPLAAGDQTPLEEDSRVLLGRPGEARAIYVQMIATGVS